MGVLGVPRAARPYKASAGEGPCWVTNPLLYLNYSIRGTEISFMVVGPGKKFSALQF